MTKARKYQVSVDDTPYYHLISRCVRRAFLCGKLGNQSYEHRRQWIVDRMKFLASIFAIDVCAYAIMSNHYHLVIKVNSTKDWSDQQVLGMWSALFKLPQLCDEFMKGEKLTQAQVVVVRKLIDEYRSRLMNLSWFMRCLNQYIATKANREDNVKGHFFEARFKSQALLDERALLTCMAYVDLNPIRAAMAKTPEQSDYTSIQERVTKTDTNLLGFHQDGIPYYLTDYIALVDYTGRVQLENKKGYIPKDIDDVFKRFNLNPDSWLDEMKKFRSKGRTAVGTISQLKVFCQSIKSQFVVANKLSPALE